MRYVQLRAFHFVCLHGGFSKAASALCLTQPAVSDQVRKLEEEYDILLFSRSGKGVSPTTEGLALLEISRRFFNAGDQAKEYLTEQREVTRGTLRIIADSAMHLIDILGLFRIRYPEVSIQILSGNSDTVLSRLKNYEADVGVIGTHEISGEFNKITLAASRLIAFVGQTHNLAQCKSITFSKLLRQTLVLREHGSKTRASFDQFARQQNTSFRATVEAQGREAVHEIVAAGTGVGIVSEAELARDPRLIPLPISDCHIKMQESLICLNDRAQSRNIRSFFQTAEDFLTGSSTIEPGTSIKLDGTR